MTLTPLLQGSEGFGTVMVLRTLRVFRLARVVRLVVQFKTLWMLVRGLLGSVDTMCYITLLIVLLLYIYACIGLELITKAGVADMSDAYQELVGKYFSGLLST